MRSSTKTRTSTRYTSGGGSAQASRDPGPLAEADADNVDWHQIADLMQRGCPPRLALRIIR
jgi:hypothetical protein